MEDSVIELFKIDFKDLEIKLVKRTHYILLLPQALEHMLSYPLWFDAHAVV